MRVLVDTSVWSLSFRKGGPANHTVVRKLAALLTANGNVVLTGLILQEILQAFRPEAAFHKAVDRLEPFPLLEVGRADYVTAARLHRRCASKGLAVTTADCQIAAAAIRHDCLLLTADKDFERIARVANLKLA
ncbi:MAG: PIN domain nuclease [Gemmatimonadetes bacterium]|nr:PIN domain nuclease [Gemmatimonadota bacterium]MCH8935794.1 PIN domain nuclease [Gemmatimonadota bacterium]